MTATTYRAEFAPPPPPGLLRAFALALLAHVLLVLMISAGVQWKRDTVQPVVEAELWSALPVQAAPPPEPMPLPQPEPITPVKPAPVAEPPPAPTPSKADIAIAREKDKALKEKQLALEKEKAAQEKLAKQKKQAELEKQKQDKQEQDKLAKAKEEQQRKLAQQAEVTASKARSEQIKRMAQLAGNGSGASDSGNTAAQSSGPSAAYAGRIVARIKPNISYPDNIDGNPRVEVEIRTSPTGTILSTRITQSSGVKSWDEAVTRAIAKTEVLPRDVDGSVPPSLLVGFRPKD